MTSQFQATLKFSLYIINTYPVDMAIRLSTKEIFFELIQKVNDMQVPGERALKGPNILAQGEALCFKLD